MKVLFVLAVSALFFLPAQGRNVFKIQPESVYKRHKGQDLERRIWDLERAVSQLQDQVFHLSKSGNTNRSKNSHYCYVEAMGERYPGIGSTEAEAKKNAIVTCKTARKNSFFCKAPKCDN